MLGEFSRVHINHYEVIIMNRKKIVNTLKKLRVCQKKTDELNDCLLDLLDQMKGIQPCEELEELRNFCNQLTKWSDFSEAKLVIENIPIDQVSDCNE